MGGLFSGFYGSSLPRSPACPHSLGAALGAHPNSIRRCFKHGCAGRTPKITAVQCAVLRHGEMNEKVVHRSCVRVHLSVCAERACRDLVQALCPLRRRPCDREDLANPHLRGRSQAFFLPHLTSPKFKMFAAVVDKHQTNKSW